MENRKLLSEVRNVINLFRKLFQEDGKLSRSIDKTYEETLLEELSLIPEQFDKDILHYLEIGKIFLHNIDFASLGNELKNISFPKCNTKSISLFEKMIGKLALASVERARIMNLSKKFIPIFDCIDKILSNPKKIIDKYAELEKISAFNIL